MKEQKLSILRLFNALLFVAMVVVNALAAQLPINGITPGQVSDSYPNLFAPAGLTFSIWGVIYILLALFILYQFGVFKGKSGTSLEAVKRIGPWFIISSLANIAWIFSWHYKIIPLSMLLMLVILVSLITAYTRLNKGTLNKKEKFFVRLPFSIYFGWITVATIANATVLLVSIGWNGFGISEQIWTVVALAAALVIGAATTMKNKDGFYGLVILWAFLGILIKHLDVFKGRYIAVIIAAAVGMALILVDIIMAFVKSRARKG